ncbi:MAG: hypothetical protein H6Q30_3196, partial [Bacteroidetes bacterium]|nr:hypothetical protein [Bacteroidota bacterium]
SGDTGKPIVMNDQARVQSELILRIARNMAAQVSIRNAGGKAPAVEIQLN